MIATSNGVDKVLKNWSRYYAGHDVVFMPSGWKDLFPVPYTFVYTSNELTAAQYISFFRCCVRNNIRNPRLFTPRTLEYSSCFHPSFYLAVQKNYISNSREIGMMVKKIRRLEINTNSSDNQRFSSIHFWLQSVIFLAGVTLSAAIIQNRWSTGTLESKLNRLWQLAQYKEMKGLEAIKFLEIEKFVLKCSTQLQSDPKNVLKELKLFYSKVLKELVKDISADKRELKKIKLTAQQEERFGFINELEKRIGKDNIQCVIAYGSAVNSEMFADYDLIIIVKDLEEAMFRLAGKLPKYKGLELNISLFDKEDFLSYQLASGDNLANHALCLYGTIEVPHKDDTYLIARNYSFGFVRFRQLMGMAAHYGNISSNSDDKLNLLNYFIKIPMNVFKGIQGCYGNIGTNEEIKAWAKETIGFDVTAEQLKAKDGFSMDSIASATWATQEVMHWFNIKNKIFSKEDNSANTINLNQKISL